MSSSNGRGAANDARVVGGTHPDDPPEDYDYVPSPWEHVERPHPAEYHEQLADDAERAVKNTQQTIADLEKSLKGRQAEARQHRESAKRVRAEMED